MNSRTLGLVFLGTLLSAFVPHVVRAEDFVSIVPLPFAVSDQTTIGQYLNGIFRMTLSLAAGLAVIMLVIGGFEYMTSEAMGGKTKGRERIQGAVIGLVLLLASYLILYVINPCILELDIFSSSRGSGCQTPSASSGSSFQPPSGSAASGGTGGTGSSGQGAGGSGAGSGGAGTGGSGAGNTGSGAAPQVLASQSFSSLPGMRAVCFDGSSCPATYTEGGRTYEKVGDLAPSDMTGCVRGGGETVACGYIDRTVATQPQAGQPYQPECASMQQCAGAGGFYFDTVGGRCCSTTMTSCYLQQQYAIARGVTAASQCLERTGTAPIPLPPQSGPAPRPGEDAAPLPGTIPL